MKNWNSKILHFFGITFEIYQSADMGKVEIDRGILFFFTSLFVRHAVDFFFDLNKSNT